MNGPLDWLRMLDIAAVCAACSPLFGFGIVVLVCLAAWRFVLPHVAANTLKGT